MKPTRTNPVLNRPAQGQSSREFLKNLEDLMKRNKGGFGAMAFDVGSNQPYRVGGRVQPVGADTPSLQWQLPPTPQAPEIIPQNYQYFSDPVQYGDVSLSDNPTASEMLDAIFNAAWSPQLPTTEQLDALSQQTGEAYPVQSMNDGTVRYSDGSVRQVDQSKPPMPIASMADGNVLWSDGFTRQMPPGGLSQYLAGVQGLSQFIFGQNQQVTQDYGNYNPALEPGSGINYGTDFRTRDLQQRDLYAPVPMEVVQVLQDDGTRWGDQSGHQGYGNSVLVRLPSGEMIRLSHLSSMGNLQVGQVLNPGDLIGKPGATGNTSGEHLDVEYYNAQGQIDNPNNFRQNVSQYSIANQITGTSPYSPQSQQPAQVTQQTQQQTPSSSVAGAVPTPVSDTISAVGQLPQQAGAALNQATEPARQATATAINQANPTGNFDLGITERLQGNQQKAGQVLGTTIANTGQALGVPEGGVSEAAQTGGLTGALRQLAGNVIDTASTPLKKIGVPDFGLSEKIAQGPTINTGANFIPANAMETGTQSKTPQPQDYANVLDQNVQNVGQQLQAKAGEGVNSLKSFGEGVKNLFQQGVDKIAPKRTVGDQSGSVAQEVGQTTQKVMSQGKNDIRDPFFKMGGAQLYSKYVAPNAEQQKGGALSLDLFSPDFFQNADNVANVFGSTGMGQAATDKFRASETNKYPMSSFSPMSYGDGSWNSDYRSAVDRYNQEGSQQTQQRNQSITDYLKSIPSVLKSTFSFQDTPKPTSPRLSFGSITKTDAAPKMSYAVNPQMSFNRSTPQMSQAPSSKLTAPQMSFARNNAPQMSVAPLMSMAKPVAPQRQQSLEDYLRMGKTREQYYAETGQQSAMDSMKSGGQWNDAGKQMSVGPQQGVTNAINAASAGQTYISPSGNAIPNYSPANANMTDASTGLPVVGKAAPYPIAQMADGRVRYSDGSIR